MPEEEVKRICRILQGVEARIGDNFCCRPGMPGDVVNALRTLISVREVREELRCPIEPNRLVSDICSRAKELTDDLVRVSERRGQLYPDPATFGRSYYWLRRAKEKYKCPE